MQMVKFLFSYGLAIIINLAVLGVAIAAPIDNIRYSNSADKVRLVLDSKAPIQYSLNRKNKELLIKLPNSNGQVKKVGIKDAAIQGVVLRVDEEGSSYLQVKLTNNYQHKIFTLAKPYRLVIDILKNEKFVDIKDKKIKDNQPDKAEQLDTKKIQTSKTAAVVKIDKVWKVQDGIKYRFIQDELNGKQFQAYILIVEKDSDFELRPFSAAGVYNGRGSLLAQAKNLGLVAAVNSSYFDSDGWVVGVTKDRGRFISVEESPHSAFIVNKGVPKIIKDVAYYGYMDLYSGKRLVVKGMNRMRIADDCVVYNNAFAKSTKTNQWGREIKLKNGRVISVSKLGDMSIEPDTVIVSAHGTNAQLLAGVRPGMRLQLNETLGNEEANQAETVVGAGPLLVENSLVNVRSREENIANDIAGGRAPRTAIGVRKNQDVILVVVDGRSNSSCGMTLQELAAFMVRLGAKEALNFDGGGSSEMVLKGNIVNKPSDGKERLVSMGLGVFRK